jgi:hypothetical protein
MGFYLGRTRRIYVAQKYSSSHTTDGVILGGLVETDQSVTHAASCPSYASTDAGTHDTLSRGAFLRSPRALHAGLAHQHRQSLVMLKVRAICDIMKRQLRSASWD